jgi:hypothetical protein
MYVRTKFLRKPEIPGLGWRGERNWRGHRIPTKLFACLFKFKLFFVSNKLIIIPVTYALHFYLVGDDEGVVGIVAMLP